MHGEWTPCEMCGRTAVHTHHVYFGTANRKISDANGMTVNLCYDCHALVHADYEIRKKLCRKHQRIYEREHSREEFIALIGRSYL